MEAAPRVASIVNFGKIAKNVLTSGSGTCQNYLAQSMALPFFEAQLMASSPGQRGSIKFVLMAVFGLSAFGITTFAQAPATFAVKHNVTVTKKAVPGGGNLVDLDFSFSVTIDIPAGEETKAVSSFVTYTDPQGNVTINSAGLVFNQQQAGPKSMVVPMTVAFRDTAGKTYSCYAGANHFTIANPPQNLGVVYSKAANVSP